MASLNKRISDLPDNAALDGTELFEIQKGTTTGSSQKLTLSALLTKIGVSISRLLSITASDNYVEVDATDPQNPTVGLSNQVAAYDKSGSFTKPQIIPPLVNNAATGAITPALSANSNFEYTLTGNLTVSNPTGAATGQFINMMFIIGATSYTVTLGSVFKLLNGSSVKTDANTINILSGYVASDGNIYCNVSQ